MYITGFPATTGITSLLKFLATTGATSPSNTIGFIGITGIQRLHQLPGHHRPILYPTGTTNFPNTLNLTDLLECNKARKPA